MEQLQARYATDPNSVDASWQAFFKALGDDKQDAQRNAEGASWTRSDWPPLPNDDLTAALTGEWPVATPRRRQRPPVRRSPKGQGPRRRGVGCPDPPRRVGFDPRDHADPRLSHPGHLAADLDPLGVRQSADHPELDPASYGFTEGDMDRPIFLDNVLGMEHATMRQIVDIVKRTYCGTFALQYMHISDPEQSAWLKERIEGYGKEITFTREGRRAILNKLVEAEGFEKFSMSNTWAPSASALTGARRSSRRWSRSSSGAARSA